MAGDGRSNADEALALALAAGKTLREAAKIASVGERTAARRWADPSFRSLVTELRGEVVERAIGRMADGMTEAADELRRLLKKARSETVRLGAARSLLELTVKLRDAVELERRLTALEGRHRENPDHEYSDTA